MQHEVKLGLLGGCPRRSHGLTSELFWGGDFVRSRPTDWAFFSFKKWLASESAYVHSGRTQKFDEINSRRRKKILKFFFLAIKMKARTIARRGDLQDRGAPSLFGGIISVTMVEKPDFENNAMAY